MLLRHGLGSHDADQYVYRQSVDRFEVDTSGADGDGSSKLLDAVEAAVGNRNTATDTRARQALALAKNLVKDFFIDRSLRHREQRRDRAQGGVLVAKRQANPDAFRMEEVDKHDGQAIHQPSQGRNAVQSSGWRRDSPLCRRRSVSVAFVSRT